MSLALIGIQSCIRQKEYTTPKGGKKTPTTTTTTTKKQQQKPAAKSDHTCAREYKEETQRVSRGRDETAWLQAESSPAERLLKTF